MELTFTGILLRASTMFLAGLVLMRILGKPSIGELSTMDFVVINALGDGFDSVIFGEVTILQGIVGLTTVVLVHILVSVLSARSKAVFRLANSPPTLMIQSALVQGGGMVRERMRPEMVAAEMRLKMEDQLTEVQEAWLETNGKLSVIKHPSSKTAQKQDLKLLR